MKLLRVCVILLVAISSSLALGNSAAQAAPPLRNVIIEGHICVDAGSICVPEQPASIDGVGQDIKIIQFNQCSGAGTVCVNEINLNGSFGKVVVQGTNECTDGALCTNLVRINGSASSVRTQVSGFTFEGTRIKNRCDSTSICSSGVE